MDPQQLERLAKEIGDEILAGMSTAVSAQADAKAISALIDHTILKPEATREDVLRVCDEARQYGFATVCVNPQWVATAAYRLDGSNVKVCTVSGFPLGANSTPVKVLEALEAIKCGAREIDMVLAVGALRGGDFDTVRLDIQAVAKACHDNGSLLKVILETSLLDNAQKTTACQLAQAAGADFVKTSTGFSKSGATAEDIALMRAAVGPRMGVKASGGIRTLADLQAMVAAGATRIGASAGVSILGELGSRR